jgi:hypothetical protein
MTLEHLENLVRINKLKQEPPDQREFDGLLSSARRKLADARIEALSLESQFSLAYSAAHTVSLAALRWHGYRSDNRYLVFQCLKHTLGVEDKNWRLLDLCHQKRNKAEYEGLLDISDGLVDELITIADELIELVEQLGPIE